MCHATLAGRKAGSVSMNKSQFVDTLSTNMDYLKICRNSHSKVKFYVSFILHEHIFYMPGWGGMVPRKVCDIAKKNLVIFLKNIELLYYFQPAVGITEQLFLYFPFMSTTEQFFPPKCPQTSDTFSTTLPRIWQALPSFNMSTNGMVWEVKEN